MKEPDNYAPTESEYKERDINNFSPESIENMFKDARNHWSKLEEEFRKIIADPSLKNPEQGDTVVVAAGLLNMGHPWIRKEATVIQVGETSYKISFNNYKMYGEDKPYEIWIHPRLITDVIKKDKTI